MYPTMKDACSTIDRQHAWDINPAPAETRQRWHTHMADGGRSPP